MECMENIKAYITVLNQAKLKIETFIIKQCVKCLVEFVLYLLNAL